MTQTAAQRPKFVFLIRFVGAGKVNRPDYYPATLQAPGSGGGATEPYRTIMRTFSIHTLGCKVNQYESEQLAGVLRAHGLEQVERDGDLRVVNTCSVTVSAAGKSRQSVRRAIALPVLTQSDQRSQAGSIHPVVHSEPRPRVVVTGCWATSHSAEIRPLDEVDAVLTHHGNVAEELTRLLARWRAEDQTQSGPPQPENQPLEPLPEPHGDNKNGWINQAGIPAHDSTAVIKSFAPVSVKEKIADSRAIESKSREINSIGAGTTTLPILGQRHSGHQRAFVKVQDGCDAHCTYCIIPQLRPRLWSKPVDLVVQEARQLVAAGHVEIVLTGIFLGAYGQPTALRRRQNRQDHSALSWMIEALCTQVPGLLRVRLSSLEPGDLADDLIDTLRAYPQVVPHFHLPLQSGSAELLRRMNRQYTRDDYLRMIARVHQAFDRPALTTDIIVGFPGETDEQFQRTLEVVDEARFIHIHAFPYSPRPKTAAARWRKDFVHGPVTNQRMAILAERTSAHSLSYRQQFLGQTVQILVERNPVDESDEPAKQESRLQHGRCERYFSVFIDDKNPLTGRLVRVRVDRVTPHRTLGTLIAVER